MCVEDTRCAFDDEPVQFLRSNRFPESLAKPVQEIENERFFDLNFFMGAFQTSNSPRLVVGGENPTGHRRNKQSEEKSRPHDAGPAYFEDVL